MSSGVRAERYDPSARDTWDALVGRARARHFMFKRPYMEYHAERFADASFVILLDDRPVAAFPASRQGDEVVSHGGLTFGGLLSDSELTTVRTIEALEAITTALRADGVRTLTYKPVPHIYHLAPAEEDLFALHTAGARLAGRELTVAIPAGRRPEYSTERRRAIQRGRGGSITLGGDGRVEEFMALTRTVLRERHGVEPVHSATEMRLLADRFPDCIRLFTAAEDGQIVSGVLIYETPSVAHAQYIVAGQRGRELRANDALFDHLLRDVYSDRWFDFGISNERNGDLNAGLLRWFERSLRWRPTPARRHFRSGAARLAGSATSRQRAPPPGICWDRGQGARTQRTDMEAADSEPAWQPPQTRGARAVHRASGGGSRTHARPRRHPAPVAAEASSPAASPRR
jgi:hypothetical protein